MADNRRLDHKSDMRLKFHQWILPFILPTRRVLFTNSCSSFIVAASWNDNAYAFLRSYTHTHTVAAIAMPRFVSFGGGDVCSFLSSLVLSFVPSFVRAFVRPSARWYWPCNWAQTLSSARPAKDYTPACPEGLEPNVLVWYIMLQIPVSDSRGKAGVNGVTFSVLRVRFYTTAPHPPSVDIDDIHILRIFLS